MDSKAFATILLVLVAAGVLVVLALRVKVPQTVDSVAILATTGLTCENCSGRIARLVDSVNGVAVTEVDVARGWVVIGYIAGKIKPEALAEQVNGSGLVSKVYKVLTPEQFKQVTGRNIGQNASSGCCGSKGVICGPPDKH